MTDLLYDVARERIRESMAALGPDADRVPVALTAAVPGRMPDQLRDYWVRGEGAAKIRWGTDGAFDRCTRMLRKYFPGDPKGLCAKLHKRATGEWPAEKGVESAADTGTMAGDTETLSLLFDPAAVFHLPGGHNQATHGNRHGKINLPSATGLGSKVGPQPAPKSKGKAPAKAAAPAKPASATAAEAEERIKATPARHRPGRPEARARAAALGDTSDSRRAALVDEYQRVAEQERKRDAQTAGAVALGGRVSQYERDDALTSPEVAAATLAYRRAVESDSMAGRSRSYGAGDESTSGPAQDAVEKAKQAANEQRLARARQAGERVRAGDVEGVRELLGPEPNTQAALDYNRATEPNRAGPLAVEDPTPEELALVDAAAEAQIRARAHRDLALAWDERAEKTIHDGRHLVNSEQRDESGRLEAHAREQVKVHTDKQHAAEREAQAAVEKLDRSIREREDATQAQSRAAMRAIADVSGPEPDLGKVRAQGGRDYRKQAGFPSENADKKALSARDRNGGLGTRRDEDAEANRERGSVTLAAGELHYLHERDKFFDRYIGEAEAQLARDDLNRDTRAILASRLLEARQQKASTVHEIPLRAQELAHAEQRYRDNRAAAAGPNGNALGQSEAQREERGRIMLGDAEYERRRREERIGSPKARKATAQQLAELSTDDFWEKPETEREAIKAELRDLIKASEYDRVTIPSNRTSMGTTIRNATPDYVMQANNTLARFGRPKPEPKAPPATDVRGRLAEATGPGAGDKLKAIARDIGMTDVNYKAGYLRKLIEMELWRQEDALRAHAGPHADHADYDPEEAERALAFLDERDEEAERIMPMITQWAGMLAPIGKPTGDRRIFEPGSLANRPLPMPLLWQEKSDDGHMRSSVVGSIREIEHREDGTYAAGHFLDEELFPDVARAKALLRAGVNGPSVDLDDVAYGMRNADGSPFDEVAYMAAMEKGEKPAKPLMSVSQGRISAATLVSIPAFAEVAHTWTLTDMPDEEGFSAALAADLDDCEDCTEAAALAASGYLAPPAAAFAERKLAGPTGLTIDGDAVYGHLAVWSSCHVGFPGACVTPPRSHAGYAFFHTGEVLTAEGERVSVGRLVLGAKHADIAKGYRASAQHYDETGRVVALVRAYEDEHGIAFSGVLVQDLDAESRAEFAAMPLSGDWRRIGGNLELIGAISVPVPGFPVARAVEGGRQAALVAAGVLHSPDAQAVDGRMPDGRPVKVTLNDSDSFTSDRRSITIEFDGSTDPAGFAELFKIMSGMSIEEHAAIVSGVREADASSALGPDASAEFAARVDAELSAVRDTLDRERARLLDGLNLGE